VPSLAGLGRPSIAAALLFAIAAAALCVAGALRHRRDLTVAGVRCVVAVAGFVGLAVAALVSALFAHDFSVEYVANYSSRSLTGPYTLGALWGGMEGSLLFWTLLLTVFGAVALTRAPARTSRLVAWAGGVLSVIAIFFLALLSAPASPFASSQGVPADGVGLNPLLQSPAMLVHPPLLYTGFVGFSIPFAFAMAALFTKRLDDGWFTATRRWTLFAWSALSVGIVLGGAWAYTELGWGGYWAWDPVENASFMPWLTATAFLHSVVIQEKRRMFKVWNVTLILLTYFLAVFGTFLTRSGILSSIHTFTEGDTGKWFLPFLGAMLIGGLSVVAWRAEQLRSENRFDSLLSRESAFLFNNVMFVAAAFGVLLVTMYPIIKEAIDGVRVAVSPATFNTFFVPWGLVLIVLTGIGPLIAWRRMSRGAMTRVLRVPVAAGGAAALVLWVAGVRSAGALTAFALCAFTAVAIGSEFVRGSRAYRARGAGWGPALGQTLARNRRRYGGYVVHLGVVLIVIGLAGAAFRSEGQAHLQLGETMGVGDYTLEYAALERGESAEKAIAAVEVAVTRGGDHVTTLRPQRNFHFAQGQPQSEVAIRTTPIEDLYLVVTSVDPDGDIALRAFVNPLTWWIWVGAAVMGAGIGVILSSPAPVGAKRPSPRRIEEPAVVMR
jgi:cytochrome c-type biogenesis protein CcmF